MNLGAVLVGTKLDLAIGVLLSERLHVTETLCLEDCGGKTEKTKTNKNVSDENKGMGRRRGRVRLEPNKPLLCVTYLGT